MENKTEFQELMERLDKSNRKQARYAMLQCLFSIISAVCCVGLFLLVYSLLPQLQELSVQVENVLANIETVSAELAAIDFEGMLNNIDSLVSSSQVGIEEAVGKLNALDFDSLNKAIKNLADVVERLGKLGKLFG